jgi:aspartyl-tRNA(Asn)/glutamyl-tRNA(Gln) amidotransferase subunit C
VLDCASNDCGYLGRASRLENSVRARYELRPMKLSHKDLLYVAELARLEIPEGMRETLERQFNEIVAYVEKLNELTTDGIEPTTQVIAQDGLSGTPLAEDKPGTSLSKETAVANAPAKQEQFFKVPRMIESEEG